LYHKFVKPKVDEYMGEGGDEGINPNDWNAGDGVAYKYSRES